MNSNIKKISSFFILFTFLISIHSMPTSYVASVVEYSPLYSLDEVTTDQAIKIMVNGNNQLRKINNEKRIENSFSKILISNLIFFFFFFLISQKIQAQ